MDAEHEAALARILAQREKRGHLLDRRAVTGRQSNVAAAAQDEAFQRELDARTRALQAQEQVQQQQQQQFAAASSAAANTNNQQQQAALAAQAQQLLNQQQQLDQERQRLAAMQQQQQRFLDEQQRRAESSSQPQAQQLSMSPANLSQPRSGSAANTAAGQPPYANAAQSPTAPPSPMQQQQQQQYRAAAASPLFPQQQQQVPQQQQQQGFAQFFEKGRFANFRQSPILHVDDIRVIRPYVKGQGPGAKSVICFGDDGAAAAGGAVAVGGGAAVASGRQSTSGGGGAGEFDDPNSRTPSAYAANNNNGNNAGSARSLSQQRYPGATPFAAGRTPSVAQLASQARHGLAVGGAPGARSISGGPGGVASGAPAHSAARSASKGGGGGAAANPVAAQLHRELEEMNARISENNPFRTQTLDEYLVAPNETAVPVEVLQVLQAARSPMAAVATAAPVWNHKGEMLTAPMEGATVQPFIGQPLFNFQTACGILVKGDWFLKWTRVKDKVHRRFFRVSPDGAIFMWGPNDETPSELSRTVRVQDIASIEPSSIVDETTDVTTYVMTIWCASRVLQIGTEYREKFDIWYETLRLLAQRQRRQNHAFAGRHSTMVPESETAAATSMVMRRGMMGGRISSTD